MSRRRSWPARADYDGRRWTRGPLRPRPPPHSPERGFEDDRVAALTIQELGHYLFRPGFTTAPRGDLRPRRRARCGPRHGPSLAGQASLQSSSPHGAVFALTVPVTVSTVRVLRVLCRGQYYGVPTTWVRLPVGLAAPICASWRAVPSCRRRPAGSLGHLGDLIGGRGPAQCDGQAWPYFCSTARPRAAVAVDDLEDESEVLLKPLGFPLEGLPGSSAPRCRPDGSVQLVLDLSSTTWGTVEQPARPECSLSHKTAGRILVVDDSPTTRTVLRNVFTAAGYTVPTATDGVDALDRLRHAGHRSGGQRCGDAAAGRLRLDSADQVRVRLPVILVTGREKEESRRKGCMPAPMRTS